MRILYDHQVFSLQDAGGASRYHYELVRHLQRIDDVRQEIAIGVGNSVYPFSTLHNSETRVRELRASLRPGILRYALNEMILGASFVTNGIFDIYHPTLYRAMPTVRRRRLVTTHHDCAHELFPGLFRHSDLVVKNKRKLFAEADAIICVSESSRRDLLQYYGVEEGRTVVIHHGFAPFTVGLGAADISKWIAGNYLLFVGFRGTYKNFKMLLDAYSASGIAEDYDLLAVGGGRFIDHEVKYISKLGLVNRIKNVQRPDDAALATIYRNASLFVYPSLHEGFGFPPLEAMSAGCPVLVSNTSSLPEVCGNAAFYFDPTDPADLVRALELALNDQELCEIMRTRGFEQVRLYDWSQTAAATLQVYKEVMN